MLTENPFDASIPEIKTKGLKVFPCCLKKGTNTDLSKIIVSESDSESKMSLL